ASQKRAHRVPSPLIIEITEHVLRPIIGIALLLASVTAAAQRQGPEGIWLTEDRDGAVEIFNCGAHLCGRIGWQQSPPLPGGSQLWRRAPADLQRCPTAD